jgi:acyl transferase domain-containing protein/NADPH:quinone reductase-like Zn-dependent oxidoreductase/acyl carrier protein/short-subunit dehydrogenase
MTVEIIGRAAMAPGADSPEALFELLKQRRCMITKVPGDRWDHARYWHPEIGTRGKTYTFAAGVVDDCFAFDPVLFGMSQREAQLLDPQQRMILQLTWRALESAHIDFDDLRDQRVGVYVGASALDHGNLIVEDPAAGGPHFMTGNTLSIVSNRISHVFGLNGPSLTVDTACSSSLVALDLAMKALEAGEVDTAIVGGVNALTHPLAFVGFAAARMLSPEGLCRAYDNDGLGYVRAEGGAVVILRRTDQAQGDHSFARILATGVNSAGRTNGISLPSREAQAALLRSLYSRDGIDPNRLAFIEGHGTGTKVGDPAEVWSIGTVVGAARRVPIPIGSIKTNIGHAEPASGMLGLMKAMLALEHNMFPASLHFETPNEAVDFSALKVHVASEPIELLHGKHPRLAGINSFGFGGTNAHVIIADPANSRDRDGPEAAGRVFMASAHTASALDALLVSYRESFARAKPAERKSLIAASGANPHLMRHRFVVANDDPESVARAIADRVDGRKSPASVQAEAVGDAARIAYVFSGNGSQWAGMAVDAYRGNVAFRDRFNVIHALFQVRSQISLTDLLFDENLETKLQDTKIAQPLLFATQAALSDVLSQLGVEPHAVYGHSVGEVAAAYASGAISLVDAVQIVAKRSWHQDRLAGMGRMAALQIGPDEARAFFSAHALDELSVAAVNARGSVTVSGPSEQIMALKDAMRSARIVGQVLDINYPFHHPLIEVAKEDFLQDMGHIALRQSQRPFISTVTGQILGGEMLDASYWWSNVREPVEFHSGTLAAIDLGCSLFVEIGPRPILQGYLRDSIKERSVAASPIPSLARDEPGTSKVDPVAQTFARIIAHGGAFDRRKVFGHRNIRVKLPPVPFERADLRVESTSDTIDLYGRQNVPYTLAGWRVDPASGTWKNHLDAHVLPDLAEHVVDGKSILPGSGFLEMAISAGRAFLGTGPVEITDMEILQPLELSEVALRETSTTISEETGAIVIRSRDRLSGDDWTIHAVARCRKLPSAATPAAPASIRRSSGKTMNGEAAYRIARAFGLDYGPSFRLLKSATTFGRKSIQVEVAVPPPPGNPHIRYTLHPISVDAVFHGLVAAFAGLAGTQRGAPYIPVRFGSVRLVSPEATIAKAVVDISRVSVTSIQASFRLMSARGEVIAILKDCRFRRTFLRQQRDLAQLSFHQSAVPSVRRLGAEALPTVPKKLYPAVEATGSDSAAQMFKAVVYRACHDVACAIPASTGRIALDMLPGDAPLRRFLSNCLTTLDEVGLVSSEGDNMVVAADSGLPAVAEILQALARDCPGRIAEISAINHVHGEVLQFLAASGRPSDDDLPMPRLPGDATLDAIRTHAPAVEARLALLHASAEGAMRARPIRRIVEIGSVSRSASARLAAMAAAAGGHLTIIEDSEEVLAELAIAFERSPAVTVLPPSKAAEAGTADLVVSAAPHAFRLLSDAAFATADWAGLLENGTQIAIAVPAPNAVDDFIFGLESDWFYRSADTAFPIGALASIDDWRGLIRGSMFQAPRIAGHELADGGIILVEATCKIAGEQEADAGLAAPLVVRAGATAEHVGPRQIVLGNDRDANAWVLDAGMQSAGTTVIYLPEPHVAGDGADALSDVLLQLSTLGEALQRLASEVGDDAASPIRLGVLLAAGAPVGNPDGAAGMPLQALHSAVWTFLRVMRNEFESIDIHAFDMSRCGTHDDSERMEIANELMAGGSACREWCFDPETAQPMELRVAPGPVPETDAAVTRFEAATIRQGVAAQVMSLHWEQTERPQPEAGEVCIEVTAAGLNFRDVMWAMGMLPEEALEDGFAGPTIGMECAGRISAVGEGVTTLSVGDPVMAVAPAAFSTHVVVGAQAAARLPDVVDLRAGATIPVAFLTAYYSLVELARLGRGETVLVHGGAGGVGLAALQVAKARGATVIATAGSAEKRRLLETFGADYVFSSRTLDFVEDVMRITDGAGVDVVLNSLFGEAMERSLSLVKPFGRFLELGKRDFYSDTKVGLRPFRRNVSYFGIDADQLLKVNPELSMRLMRELSDLFADGTLTPLPFRAFHHDEITSAFRLMQGSGHIGKILVLPPVSGQGSVARAPRAPFEVDPSGIHLVVGGIGGFGLAAAEWLVERGARRIALCSRRGVPDDATSAAIAAWAAAGVDASIHACDVTDETSVSGLLAQLRAQRPLKTVIHAAMVLDDALITNLNEERYRAVIEPKARGAAILDRLTRDDALDQFILFSSATTLVGNPGQANYVAANGYLEGLARARRAAGLPALAVGFGAIADTGFLARNTEVNEILAKRIGKTALPAMQALDLVEAYISRDPGTVEAAVVAIADIDMAAARQLRTVASPLFSVAVRSAKATAAGGDGDTLDLVAMVHGKTQEEGEQIVFDLVAGQIAAILRIPTTEITPAKIIKEVGLDSLMAMELGMSFRQKTGFEMPLSSVTQSTTVGDVAQKLYAKITQRADAAEEAAELPEHLTVLDHLASRHTNTDKAANS